MMMKKVVCAILSGILFCISVGGIPIAVRIVEAVEERIACDATLEDNFADNKVIVILNNETSLAFNTYDVNDFSEIECLKVDDLTMYTKEKVYNQVMGVVDEDSSSACALGAIDETKYNQILCLTLKCSSKVGVLEAIDRLESRKDIIYVGPSYTASLQSTYPNDHYYEEDQWGMEKIEMPKAWDITKGSTAVLVGVIDSGIDASHDDLEGQLYPDLHMDFTGNAPQEIDTPIDTYGHGTAVAGIIGAKGNNSIGVTGVCWNVSLVSLRVAIGEEWVSEDRVAAAIDYANGENIPILNLSLRVDHSALLQEAVETYPGLMVCAAGNDGTDNDLIPVYPASYSSSNIISVGAAFSRDERFYESVLDENGKRVKVGSNYGVSTVDLFAPGVGIRTTVPDDGYDYLSRTSMATPFVTGVAALMLSYNPYLTSTQIRQIIIDNVDVIYDADGNSVFGELCVSGGRLNAYKAVRAAYHTHDEYLDVDPDWHTYNCETCDHCEIEVPHEYVRYGINKGANSGTTHRKYCHCGYYVVEDHVVRAANDGSTMFPAECIICGFTATGGGIAIVNIPITPEIMTMGTYTLSDGTTVQILTENGSYVLPSGIIVLVDEDADLAEAGLLDPYALVENLPAPSNPGHVTE